MTVYLSMGYKMNLQYEHTFLGQLETLRRQNIGQNDLIEFSDYQAKILSSYQLEEPIVGPFYGYLKVTRTCNSHCVYCDHWKLPSNPIPSTDELFQVIDNLHNIGTRHINLTGGEPLLRADLSDLIEYAHKKEISVCLLTNGLLLPKRFEELLEVELDAVIISIDSINPGEFHQTRGVDLELVMQGFYSLIEMKNKRPEMFGSVTSVITSVNLKSLFNLIEIANQHGIGVQFSPYHCFQRDSYDRLSPTDDFINNQTIKKLIDMKNTHNLLDSEPFLSHFPAFFKSGLLPTGFECLASYLAAFIDVDLNVRPCWVMKPVGNLRESNLENIWSNQSFQAARKAIRQHQCPKCWLLCTAEPSIFMKYGAIE
jgi:MoaA/NifB/PqqE/SkfB family radical SAM enzyme